MPAGDEAVIAYHVDRIGTLDPPLVGVYSTRGWAHPGPILYAMLAPAFRLFGGEPINLFQSAALLNIIAVCLCGWLAWRRRRLVGTVLTCGFTATLLYGLGPSSFTQIWNPHVPLLYYLALLLTCWGLAEQDWRAAAGRRRPGHDHHPDARGLRPLGGGRGAHRGARRCGCPGGTATPSRA